MSKFSSYDINRSRQTHKIQFDDEITVLLLHGKTRGIHRHDILLAGDRPGPSLHLSGHISAVQQKRWYSINSIFFEKTMKMKHLAGILFALGSLASGVTQAEIQTWRLTGITYEVSAGFDAPEEFQLGHTFNIDYAIELDTPFDSVISASYMNAVKSMAINGVTTTPYFGYGKNHIGANTNVLNSVNIVIPQRADNLWFISYGEAAPRPTNSLPAALNEMSRLYGDFPPNPPRNWINLSFTGANGVQAHPISFAPVPSPVPEPSSIALMLTGLSAVGFIARKNRKRKQTGESAT